jgi:uncharacterized membrane protein HdeD (DUF308 family)
MAKQHPFSIWFAIGLLLDVYGVMILGAGIYGFFNPPETPVVLNELHAGIWWGVLLLVMGVFYTVHFNPKKQKS